MAQITTAIRRLKRTECRDCTSKCVLAMVDQDLPADYLQQLPHCVINTILAPMPLLSTVSPSISFDLSPPCSETRIPLIVFNECTLNLLSIEPKHHHHPHKPPIESPLFNKPPPPSLLPESYKHSLLPTHHKSGTPSHALEFRTPS